MLTMNRLIEIIIVLLATWQQAASLPTGFQDEHFSDIIATGAAFAPNPRNNGKHMMITSGKNGDVYVFEDPDTSDDKIHSLKFSDKICMNGERGLLTLRVHPNFEDNNWVYLFYTAHRDGCREDRKLGPSCRLSRFKMGKKDLKIDEDSEQILFETTPMEKGKINTRTTIDRWI